MELHELGLTAQANLRALSTNPYPGRGIVAGRDETSEFLVQVYWIMGRSDNSRNRVFKADNETGRLYTEAADPAKVKDPSLIIYNAMNEEVPCYVVSNGDQTDTIMGALPKGRRSLGDMLCEREYEPDAPNFTQRITAVSKLSLGGGLVEMSILRKSLFGDGCDRLTYKYSRLASGFGFCITTYSGDGGPLPSFRGDPLLMPLTGGMVNIAETYWNALDTENRVALAVKWIEMGNGRSNIHIINKH